MDVLSDVLRVIRLSGSVFFRAEFSTPWSLESPSPEELAALMMPDVESITLFHILIEGACWVQPKGSPPFEMRGGEVIILPHGDAHVMGSPAGCVPRPLREIIPVVPAGEIPHVGYGGGGSASRFICGYLLCDQRFNPLLGALPPLLHVRRCGDHVQVGPPGDSPAVPCGALESAEADWLENTLRFTTGEAAGSRAGCAAMLARLTEILFMGVLRCYMEQLPAGRTGWLAGVRDPEVGRALQLLHAEPARKWTVEDLARAVGRSRSALARRFTELLGEPPMRYLAVWRMQLARHLLRHSGMSIPEVAEGVGFASESAFSRAFKRHVGVPPVAWSVRQAEAAVAAR